MKPQTLATILAVPIALAVWLGLAPEARAKRKPAPVTFATCTADADISKAGWTPGAVRGTWESVLQGDPRTGAYAALEKWTSGFDAGLHRHTEDVKFVVLGGKLRVEVGGVRYSLVPGSTMSIPAGKEHSSGCEPGADCVFCIEQPGAFDLVPVDPEAAKEAAEAARKAKKSAAKKGGAETEH